MKTKKRRYKGKAKGKKVKYRKLQVHREGSGQQSALGGLSLFCQLARLLKFARCVDQRVEVLKIHQGYRESDHLYHLLNSLLAGASCIEDLGRVCGHFERVCVRGDTKFGRTDVLKECISHQVQVCLLWSAYPKVVNIAEELPETAWQALERDGNRNRSGKKRRKRSNLRREKARQRGYRDKKLKNEQVAWNDRTITCPPVCMPQNPST